MKSMFLLPALLLGACHADGWADVPGAELHVVGSPELRAAAVLAADEWASELERYGCPPPFVVTERSGHRVMGRSRAWMDAEYGPGLLGMTWDDGGFRHDRWTEWVDGWIDVVQEQGADGMRKTMLHELGHAMGLEHEPQDGPGSVMKPNVGDELQPDDVRRAAEATGCL